MIPMAKKKNPPAAMPVNPPAAVPAAPAPIVAPIAPEAPKAMPEYKRLTAIQVAIDAMPEATVKGFKGMQLPNQVVAKAKVILTNTTDDMPFVTFCESAASVLDATYDGIVLALDAALKAEVDAQVAAIKAEEARKVAEARAKMRTNLEGAIKELTDASTLGDIRKLATIAKDADCYLVIHGGDGQGSGVFLRQMGSKPVAAPKGDSAASDGTNQKYTYFDVTAGKPITSPLSVYLRETYPTSHAVAIESDLKARRDRGETTSRIAAYDAYLQGKKKGDTFEIRRDVTA
jgi:hypothetical protein